MIEINKKGLKGREAEKERGKGKNEKKVIKKR